MMFSVIERKKSPNYLFVPYMIDLSMFEHTENCCLIL